MDFETDRDKGDDGDPSLSEMTIKALDILNKNQKGYFLFVESMYNIKTIITLQLHRELYSRNSASFIKRKYFNRM